MSRKQLLRNNSAVRQSIQLREPRATSLLFISPGTLLRRGGKGGRRLLLLRPGFEPLTSQTRTHYLLCFLLTITVTARVWTLNFPTQNALSFVFLIYYNKYNIIIEHVSGHLFPQWRIHHLNHPVAPSPGQHTQKIISGKLVIVPDLNHEGGGQMKLRVIQAPEVLLFHTHTRTHTHTQTHAHTQWHTHTHSDTHTHTHTEWHPHTHSDTHTHIHTVTHKHTHTNVCQDSILTTEILPVILNK